MSAAYEPGFSRRNRETALLSAHIERYEVAVEIITRCYPRDRFPQEAFYALEEILSA